MSTDRDDQKKSWTLALLIMVLLGVVAFALFLLVLPAMAGFIDAHLEPGLGLKDAAVIAFVVTLITLVVMAIAAGDGLLGELQYMIAAMGAMFLVIWVMIAWIF